MDCLDLRNRSGWEGTCGRDRKGFTSAALLQQASKRCWHWKVRRSKKPGKEVLKQPPSLRRAGHPALRQQRIVPHRCRGNKLPGCPHKHLPLGNARHSSAIATTSQAPPQIQTAMFLGFWSFAGHSFSFVAVDQRERESAEKAEGFSKRRSDLLPKTQQTSVILQRAVWLCQVTQLESPLGKVKALTPPLPCNSYLLWKHAQT